MISAYVLTGMLPESLRPFAPSGSPRVADCGRRAAPGSRCGGAMTRLQINGVEEEVAAATVAELLVARGIDPKARFLAVAVNGAVVRRAEWPRSRCSPGDEVEIVRPFSGRLMQSDAGNTMPMTDPLIIAGTTLSSRLFVGTAGYPNQQVLLDCLEASGAEMVTVSIRRISLEGYAESLVDLLGGRYRLLPNTAGCVTARDAILTAELAREALETDWVKLELIGDRETLYPDVEQLVHAADELVRKRLYRAALLQRGPGRLPEARRCRLRRGDAAGLADRLGHGHRQPGRDRADLPRSPVPVVLDAGIGTASDAALAMELGCDAVLVNTAIAKSHDPRRMAAAMRAAVEGGRLARLAGRIPKRSFAEPSSPQLGLVGS